MQARAYPACLPGARCRRSGLLSSTGGISRRTPGGRGGAASVRAVDGASAAAAVTAAADAPILPAQVTWQIVVGAVAGTTPFVVAGVEFSKRIVAQKKCEVCGGSGLVMKKDYYVRCQGCGTYHASNSVICCFVSFVGGFLPWQSWRRFFTG
ncbi:hypothetical protein BAE44_0001416 [Dichanthelium oligosanthes]|uniref:Viral late gene transcription factor 3 zinc ribbon domain-containing protein n=1 Tax=Dichanthelium oligosanthes TaxID=888268 RepID=A0A1E5WJF6_9POAL|nr:hypothetical protein BAE44_0001416 [Dichanthelium oligosanthes]